MPKLKRILIVDDDPDVLALVDLALSKLGGFQVQACESCHDALDQMDGFQPDLVLLDVMLPVLDGRNCLRMMRERGHSTPVIFLTAKGGRAQSELRMLDCVAVLSKPFNPMALVDQIKAIWATWSEAQTPAED